LFLEIPEFQLVKDAPDLDPQRRFLVMAIESIGYGDDTHTGEVKLRQHREHEIVVASNTGQIAISTCPKMSEVRHQQGGALFQCAPSFLCRILARS
jgi:hypothetical protein